MKKTMSVLLMLAIVCGVSTSALSESHVAVLRSGEIVKVIYKSIEPANVKVTISDSNGEKVFTEELISIRGFIRPYNFAELPKGDYTICVTDIDGKKTEKICFQDDPKNTENHSSAWNAHISKMANNDKRVLVTVPTDNANDFSIHIYDENDHLLYSESQKLETGYARVFNLKNIEQSATIHLVNHISGETKSLRVD